MAQELKVNVQLTSWGTKVLSHCEEWDASCTFSKGPHVILLVQRWIAEIHSLCLILN